MSNERHLIPSWPDTFEGARFNHSKVEISDELTPGKHRLSRLTVRSF